MNALVLILASFLGQPADELPGTAFAQPAADIVLRSGPGENYPGLLTLDGRTVVRLGEARGAYREVFVAAGFPVYVHRSYVQLSPQDAQVTVLGQRVNARYVPSTVGNLPVGQLGSQDGALLLLDEERDWVRVSAPVGLPLFLPESDLPTEPFGGDESTWWAERTRREAGRIARADSWRAGNTEWQTQQRVIQELEQLAASDLTRLSDDQLAQRGFALDRLAGEAQVPATREASRRLRAELDRYVVLRERVSQQLSELRDATVADESLAREARVLGLGLRFNRHGDAVTHKGRVGTIEAGDDAVVYTLTTTDGQVLKLMAAADVTDLASLVGKREVTLTGRQLNLNSVQGPVLVVHRVLLVGR